MTNAEHFKIVHENKESIKWILEQQAALRAEFMTFYKKDLKEIFISLSTNNTEDKEFQQESINTAKEIFTKYWEKSYNLVTPALMDKKDQSHER